MDRVRSHKNLSVGESNKKYFEQVERSEGFDVDHFPALIHHEGLVAPVPDTPSVLKYITNQAKSAIEHYNNLNGTAYELVKVLKATHSVIGSSHHRITFVAKQKGEEDPKTFQAHLVLFMRDIHYEFVRLKPPASKVPNSRGWSMQLCSKSRSAEELSMFASYEKYLEQVKESESFDVDKFPALEGIVVGLVQPFPYIPSEQKQVNSFAEKAIEHYNKQKSTTYEFVKVLKSTIKDLRAGGVQHFITFDAKAKDAADTKTFQASVISFMHTLDFKFVRVKSPPNKQESRPKYQIGGRSRSWALAGGGGCELSDKEIC